VRYTGVEASEYAVRRFGRRRGIRHGTFGALSEVRLAAAYDLIVVCDVLQYVPEGELVSGLRAIADRLSGVTYLEAYATEDAIEGDLGAWHHRSAEQYRRHFRRAGLTPVGMHCYVGPTLADRTVALERGQA
jgi:hypothetical protein